MHEIVRLETVGSTNEYLKSLAKTARGGLVALAEEQTGGKGRLGRSWLSLKGQGAWFSVLVKDGRLCAENAAGLVFVCALACAKSLRRLCASNDILVKWPNDIVLHGKKLCGILCESGFDGEKLCYSICGIGINLLSEHFPGELPWATSVLAETGLKLDPLSVTEAFLAEFDILSEKLYNIGLAEILDELRPVSATLGKTVCASGPDGTVTGLASDFAPDGALLIRTREGVQRVNVGDVSVRGVMGYAD